MKLKEPEQSEIHDLVDEIKRKRDELKLKIHLAKAEVHEEWEKMEPKWQHFKTKTATITKEAKGASHEVNQAILNLGHELKKAYQRIHRQL